MLRLHLPALRVVRLHGFSEPVDGQLRIDRDSFAEAAKLEVLLLDRVSTVKLEPDALRGLTGLAMLELATCGLAEIPEALTALVGSLTSLALPYNDKLQLGDRDVRTLLALPKLRMLDLRKPPLTHALTGAAPAVGFSDAPITLFTGPVVAAQSTAPRRLARGFPCYAWACAGVASARGPCTGCRLVR